MRTGLPAALLLGTLIASAQAAGDTGPAAHFVAGSVWKGAWSGDDRKANAKSVGVTLRVKSRDGEKAAVTLKFAGKGGRLIKAEGSVAADGTLRLKVTAVEGGKGGADPLDRVWLGRVEGEKVTFHVVAGDHDANSVGPNVEFTRSKDKKDKDD